MQKTRRFVSLSTFEFDAIPPEITPEMDPQTVRKFEEEIAEAIAVIMLRRSKGWQPPILPSSRTMHLMAKAAIAVYEAVAEEAGPRADDHNERRPEL